MKLLDRLFTDVSGPLVDWHIERRRLEEAIAEFAFRLAEMILVCGAAVYVERKVGSPPVVSSIMSAVVAVYARARATAGMLDLMKSHGLAPRRQRLFFWTIQGLAILLFAGIIALTNSVVPLIASAQSSN